jgi:PAS domain-containing protein
LATGGRGLFLMAQLMDDLRLCCDGGLEVRVVKRGAMPSKAKGIGARSLEAMVPGSQAYRDERQQAFLDEIGEGFAALDWEYRFLHGNAAIERFLGRPPSGLVGHTLWDLFPYAADHPAIKP